MKLVKFNIVNFNKNLTMGQDNGVAQPPDRVARVIKGRAFILNIFHNLDEKSLKIIGINHNILFYTV